MNSPRAIERAVDKFYTTALLQDAGLPTPETVVCERLADAMEAVRAMLPGGDVILKPLFGSMGHGLVRFSDPDTAFRVLRSLEGIRAVFYLQRAVDHGGRDIRAFVVGGRVIGAIEREAPDGDWRTNVARGGSATSFTLPPEWERLAIRAAEAIGGDYAGVDLLPSRDGSVFVLEVNAIPGWQGLQRATGLDVAGAIVAHLEQKAIDSARPSACGPPLTSRRPRSWRACSKPARRSRATSPRAGPSATCATRTSWQAPSRSESRSRAPAPGGWARPSSTRSKRRRAGRGRTPTSASSCSSRRSRARRSARRRPAAGLFARRCAACSRKRTSTMHATCTRRFAWRRRADSARPTEQDVRNDPTVTLVDAMRLAADRDGIAREYAESFEATFEIGAPALERARADGLGWSEAVVETFLTLLAARPDTHIARRGGAALAAQATRLAAGALAEGGVRSATGLNAIDEMDRVLRDERHHGNPGTTADLTAARRFSSASSRASGFGAA